MPDKNLAYTYFPNAKAKANSSFPYLVLNVKYGAMVPRCGGFKIMHWHEDLQFIYLIKGDIEVIGLNNQVKLHAGDGLFINRNTIHRVIQHDGCHYFGFIFPESFLKFYFASSASRLIEHITLDEKLDFIPFSIKIASDLKDLYCSILQKLAHLVELEQKEHDELYEYEILVTLSEIALLMLQSRHLELNNASTPQDLLLNTRMQKFLSFIATNFKEELSLEKLASAAFVSKSECLRCFKKALQTTPFKYLNEFRLMKGAELLKTTTLSIAQIANAVGFNQQSHFTACFKEHMGVTPKCYRNEHQARLLGKE